MDWVKIKAQHVLDEELSDAEVGQLVRFQAKIGLYERPLSKKEFKKTFTEKKLQKVQTFLQEKDGICLKKVTEKILEDVRKYLKKYRKNTEKIDWQIDVLNLKHDNFMDEFSAKEQDVTSDIDKIREDKKEKQQAAKRNPGDPDAAAAFLEKQDEEENIDWIIDRIVQIRTEESRRNGRPVKNPYTLKQSLVKAYRQSPVEELTNWKEQIAFDDSEQERREEQMRIAQEKARQEHEAQERARREQEELQSGLDKYHQLSQDDQDSLWREAEEIEQKGCPKGVKPFRKMIERRVVRMMKEQGYVEESKS